MLGQGKCICRWPSASSHQSYNICPIVIFRTRQTFSIQLKSYGIWFRCRRLKTHSHDVLHSILQVGPNSIAARDGRIREGDRILQVRYSHHPIPLLSLPLTWKPRYSRGAAFVSQQVGLFIFNGWTLNEEVTPSVVVRGMILPPPGSSAPRVSSRRPRGAPQIFFMAPV